MPSSRDVPQTPDRSSSSSTLFGAFRSLTSGRLRTQSSSPSSAATASPFRTPLLKATQRSASVASVPNARLNSLSEHDSVLEREDEDGNSTVQYKLYRDVVGGPPHLVELMDQLDRSHPAAERIVACKRICSIVEKYSLSNVLAIWAKAQDLLDIRDPPEAVEAGYALLKSCVALPELTPFERSEFFMAIASRCDDDSFDIRFQVLQALTNRGRNVEAFESSMPPFILNSLDSTFRAARTTRRSKAKKRSNEPTKEDDDLASLLQYVTDLIKFNSKIYGETDLEFLLEKVIGICKDTTQQRDIEHAIKVFDALITYTHVPKNSLKRCLEVLCSIYRQLGDLQEPTWNTLSNIFRSHVGQSSITTLLSVLLNGANMTGRESSILKGAMNVLRQLLLRDGSEGLPKVPISLLLYALKASIQKENARQEREAIQVLRAILELENLRRLLLEENDWSDLIDIVETCAQRSEAKDAKTESLSDADNGAELVPLSDATSSTEKPCTDDDLSQVLLILDETRDDLDTVQKDLLMAMFMRIGNRISDSAADNLVKYYAEERYLQPSHEHWLEACRMLLANVFKNQARPRELRLHIVACLRETYDTIESVCNPDTVSQCQSMMLENIRVETDVAVLHELVDFAVDVADRASDDRFEEVMKLLKEPLDHRKGQMPEPPASLSFWASARQQKSLGSPNNVLVTAMVRLFIRSVDRSGRKTSILFERLLDVAGCETWDVDARITSLKLLFRLRSDAKHAIIISPSSEGESMAAVLCRTVETAVPIEKTDESSPVDTSRHEEQPSRKEGRRISFSNPHSSMSRHVSRYANVPGRVSKPVLPLWMYPGPMGLPERPSSRASRLVHCCHDAKNEGNSGAPAELKFGFWLELIISLLQEKSTDWEVYSYILVHLGQQLANVSLFHTATPQIKMLRSVICEQLRNASFHEPPSYTSLRKADVAVCLYHALTMLVSYNLHFEKSEDEELVRTFLHGIGYWDRTAKWCIHALYLCCHEMPLTTSKYLDNIIQKMSQIITQPQIAIHILEFLTSLARMPDMFKNFREDEYKMVFGVSFRYLQYVRDQRERQANVGSLRHSGASREFSPGTERALKSRERTSSDDLPQYVYSLAFHVITFWFMVLKLPERNRQIPWITKNLIYTDRAGKEVTEEQSQVIMDMMQFIAYSDRDETSPDPNFARLSDGEVMKKGWLVGHSIMTIETAGRTGVSQVTSRRPCGSRYFTVSPHVTHPPRHQVPLTVGLAYDVFYTSSYVGIYPDDIFQSLYSPLSLAAPLGTMPDQPIPLPQDDAVDRAITSFDRIPQVDGHKMGVIYIGEGQTNEREILYNSMGPPDYTAFLNDLGTTVRLKGAKFNTGGLNTTDDYDGEFTIAWRDRCMEIVYHVTTMMPSNVDDDQAWTNKKRHIGNDFVNIIFNDSGLPYNFDTFPSAFNYVHIVITPEARASFVERRLGPDPNGRDRYYKVQVISKPGFPDISPAAESKMVSGRNLAAYCRLIAINASVFSNVWAERDGGEAVSSWRNRLRNIKRLRERYAGQQEGNQSTGSAQPSPASPQANFAGTMGRPEQGFKRTSVATFISEGTSRSSVLSGIVDQENPSE